MRERSEPLVVEVRSHLASRVIDQVRLIRLD
jgi:hypothetical protein